MIAKIGAMFWMATLKHSNRLVECSLSPLRDLRKKSFLMMRVNLFLKKMKWMKRN